MVPQWSGVFSKWTRIYVSRNYWRVSHHFSDQQDANAECALIFAKCAHRYGTTVDNAAWFMALYKRAVIRKFATFALRDRMLRAAQGAPHERPPQPPPTLPDAPLRVALAQASPELQSALLVLIDAPAEALGFVFGSPNPATVNRTLCRIARASTDRNLLGELRNLIPIRL